MEKIHFMQQRTVVTFLSTSNPIIEVKANIGHISGYISTQIHVGRNG